MVQPRSAAGLNSKNFTVAGTVAENRNATSPEKWNRIKRAAVVGSTHLNYSSRREEAQTQEPAGGSRMAAVSQRRLASAVTTEDYVRKLALRDLRK